jgi:hypothetical protein
VRDGLSQYPCTQNTGCNQYAALVRGRGKKTAFLLFVRGDKPGIPLHCSYFIKAVRKFQYIKAMIFQNNAIFLAGAFIKNFPDSPEKKKSAENREKFADKSQIPTSFPHFQKRGDKNDRGN